MLVCFNWGSIGKKAFFGFLIKNDPFLWGIYIGFLCNFDKNFPKSHFFRLFPGHQIFTGNLAKRPKKAFLMVFRVNLGQIHKNAFFEVFVKNDFPLWDVYIGFLCNLDRFFPKNVAFSKIFEKKFFFEFRTQHTGNTQIFHFYPIIPYELSFFGRRKNFEKYEFWPKFFSPKQIFRKFP